MSSNEGYWNAGDDRGATSGDAAMRRLRRRYESLRDDYEELLDRLGELEDRLAIAQSDSGAKGPDAPAGSVSEQLQHAIAAPWFALREDYARTAQELSNLVNSMDEIAGTAFTFKGQHSVSSDSMTGEPRHEPDAPASASDLESTQAAPSRSASGASNGNNSTIQVQVQSPSLGALLDFQEELSRLSDVARVSMSQVNEERAVLVVELQPEAAEPAS